MKYFKLLFLFWLVSESASAQDPEIIPKITKRKIPDFTNELSVGFGAVIFPEASGPGFRIQYEHFLGKKRKMALVLHGNTSYMQNTFNKAGGGDSYSYEYVFSYFAPGFRFHPIGAQHILDYSFGLSVSLGEVKRNIEYNGPRFPGSDNNDVHSDNFFYSILLENNLNLRKRGRRFVFGINFGTGLMLDDVNQGQLFYQLGVKIGSDLRKLHSGK